MKPNWIPFDVLDGPLPQEKRYVLVQTVELQLGAFEDSPGVAVGYLRYDSESNPYWIVPGGPHGKVTHWADCLGDDFEAPLWKGKQIKCNNV